MKPLYNPETHPDFALKLRLLGATYAEVADFFNVNESKIREWMQKHKDFRYAMEEGANIADASVVHSLYQRACGFSHPEDKIFAYKGEVVVVPTVKHYPPDTTAAQFWLQTRQREKWGKQSDDTPERKVGFNVYVNATDPSGKPVRVYTNDEETQDDTLD